MLIPAFELSQDEEFVTVSIRIPYAKVDEVEAHCEDTEFVFCSSPYHLRLNLPGEVECSENPSMNFNLDTKILTVKIPKAKKGQVFDGLDLITKLLTPKKIKTSAPKIEVIEGVNIAEDEDFELDWNIEQNLSEALSDIQIFGDQCGFAKSYSYDVFKLKEEAIEIFDVRDPQNKTPDSRKEERLKTESKDFDEDHYIADLYHDEEIQNLLKFKPEWEDLYDKIQANPSVSSDDLIHFTEKEKEKLKDMPKKEYILDKNQVRLAFLGLMDIIFAYAYNKRTTEGESNCESAWLINKLSSTLSWLESFSSVADVAKACIRRSLCYPLYRHFELSVTILEDVRKIFLLGRKYLIKCLLDIHQMFSEKPRHILNDLFITDYSVWMQSESCKSSKLVPLADALGKVLLTKGDIGFNLVDIESFAEIAWMAYNSSAPIPHSINREKYSAAVENEENSSAAENNLCLKMEKLAFQRKSSDNIEGCSTSAVDSNSIYNDLSEYESCSSCTSGSSCSSSNTFETDSDDSYSDDDDDIASSSDNDETESESDSENDAHRHLLKKENGEKLR